ncbi:MAG: 3-dehydroquinate synthase [Methylobacteriaceae bacterium]|jgi:3-dehydroquinate synthase|nr:3-dehydroquinate synthase [Methylobacteriaceae bacterium]
MMPRTPEIIVPVALGERAYDIVIGRGVVDSAAMRLAALKARRVLVVSDANVYPLHYPRLERVLGEAGFSSVSAHVVPGGEPTKSWEKLIEVAEAALAAKLERGDILVALGGGVVGDLTGFAAAIVRRGIRFVQVPTSLLAQVDSSVGGKTGINSPRGKNLIGAFHQPALVLADTSLVDTLPPRETKAGYAEIVKYGLINDPKFFGWCEENAPMVLSGGPERDEAVAYSCRAKADFVKKDERDTGERALLNLGHTFGHALERLAGYDPRIIVHGEGVAVGMAMAFRFSVFLGLCPEADAEAVQAHLQRVGLPDRPEKIPGDFSSADSMLEAMSQDKKVENGRLTFILARGIGKAFIEKGVSPDDVRRFLAS